MKQLELFERLSFVERDGSPPVLILDGIPIADGQLVAFRYGKSEYLRARVRLHPRGALVS